MSKQNDQYRRPRIHFSDEPAPLPASDRRLLLGGSALLLGIALMLALAMIPLRAGPDAAAVSRSASQALAADCTITQQMTYAPCGHRVTRRVPLPAELAGKQLADLANAYDGWQVTAYTADTVSMERTFPICCPQHTVLLPDENGQLCAWQNRYGDALSQVKVLGVAVGEMPDSLQDELRQGKAFDSLEALEQWMEGAES
ncbi:MAG: hypothetical protein IJE07_07415 [Clostridia bacterium]|nr:hypothetical protein [Clostridia bacterium]